MKAVRFTATKLDSPMASTMMHENPMTKVGPATLKRCPINNTFNIVGKRFAILILRTMINSKQNRFNQLLNSIEHGNPKTLSVRLREVEKHGLIKRKVHSNDPRGGKYLRMRSYIFSNAHTWFSG
jgi:DNA-binding HxlR family transcriptional regulator